MAAARLSSTVRAVAANALARPIAPAARTSLDRPVHRHKRSDEVDESCDVVETARWGFITGATFLVVMSTSTQQGNYRFMPAVYERSSVPTRESVGLTRQRVRRDASVGSFRRGVTCGHRARLATPVARTVSTTRHVPNANGQRDSVRARGPARGHRRSVARFGGRLGGCRDRARSGGPRHCSPSWIGRAPTLSAASGRIVPQARRDTGSGMLVPCPTD
jgi:hypothetical protein